MIPIFPGVLNQQYLQKVKAEKQFESRMDKLVGELENILLSLDPKDVQRSIFTNDQLTAVIDQLLDVALDFTDLFEQELMANVSNLMISWSNWILLMKCTLSGSNSDEKESPDQEEERNGNEKKVFENGFRWLMIKIMYHLYDIYFRRNYDFVRFAPYY